jgi:hypothetical protein
MSSKFAKFFSTRSFWPWKKGRFDVTKANFDNPPTSNLDAETSAWDLGVKAVELAENAIVKSATLRACTVCKVNDYG